MGWGEELEVVKESFFKGMKSELSTEGQNRMSLVKTERRCFRQREQNVQRRTDKREIRILSMAEQIARNGWGEGKRGG